MIGINIPGLVAINAVNSEEKREARKDRRKPDLVPKQRHQIISEESLMIGVRFSNNNSACVQYVRKTSVMNIT